MNEDAEQIARNAFAELRARFPSLLILEEEDSAVEISNVAAVQPGLKHQVWLGFQNEDELHFSVGSFWLEWFPCTDPGRVVDYIDSVTGFLDGTFRVLEHHHPAGCYKAELQRPEGPDGWTTVGTWSKLRVPSLRKPTFKVISNA